MERKPKVSVTVVTYNHGEWLRECLESIVTQETNFPFEVIVGDDASTDGLTRQILAEYASCFPHIVVPVFREKNIGGTQNYLDVVSRAQGEYIAHIDGDDLMLPHKLQLQADYLDAHPKISIVSHDVEVIKSDGALLKKNFLDYVPPEVSDINYLVSNGCFFSHCSKMYRKSSIISKYRSMRTVDFFYHIESASKGDIGYINKILGKYRKASGTASDINGASYSTLYQTYNDAFNRAIELGVNQEVVKRGMLRYRYGLALDYFRRKNVEEFKKKIFINKEEWKFSGWKHKTLHFFRFSPRIVYVIMLLKGALKC